MADSLVFLVNDKEPFTGNDREVFIQIQNNKPDLPVHFLLMKSSEGKTENLTSIIKIIFQQLNCSRSHLMILNGVNLTI